MFIAIAVVTFWGRHSWRGSTKKERRTVVVSVSLLCGSGKPESKDKVIQQSHAIAWRSLFTHLVDSFEIYQISENKTKRCFFLIYTHNVDEAGPGLTASLPPGRALWQVHSLWAVSARRTETSPQIYTLLLNHPIFFNLISRKKAENACNT